MKRDGWPTLAPNCCSRSRTALRRDGEPCEATKVRAGFRYLDDASPENASAIAYIA